MDGFNKAKNATINGISNIYGSTCDVAYGLYENSKDTLQPTVDNVKKMATNVSDNVQKFTKEKVAPKVESIKKATSSYIPNIGGIFSPIKRAVVSIVEMHTEHKLLLGIYPLLGIILYCYLYRLPRIYQ